MGPKPWIKYFIYILLIFHLFSGSKFIIEDIIDTSLSDHLDASHQQMTCLYHVNHLATVRTVDLSHNALSSVKKAYFLQCARTINLDNNNLHTLRDFQDLPALKELSVKNNCILLQSFFSIASKWMTVHNEGLLAEIGRWLVTVGTNGNKRYT